jgi:hypothetical protein
MNQNQINEPVVVTFRQVENILINRKEAVEALPEAAKADPSASPVEKASVMAAVGNVLNALRRAQQATGSQTILSTPNHPAAARLQSLIASGANGRLDLQPLPTGGLEAKFDTNDWFGWATVAWAKLKHLKPHPMVRPTSIVPDPFPDSGRIAVLGDWGTGLYGAPKIANAVAKDPDPFALLLHLGDVYYSGSENEVNTRFLNLWPYRKEAINRALNSNHEMYSGGEPYFTKTLPKFGQSGSYFAYQNKAWTLIGLDTAYIEHSIDDTQAEWLNGIINQAGNRRVILFSHHQLYSHFESQGLNLWSHPRFGKILRSKRISAWYWGHEHRCSVFEGPDSNFGILARCIGHSGMPESRDATRQLPLANESQFAMAEWRRSLARSMAGNPLPNVTVLDGPNLDIPSEEDKFSPHGYAILTFDGPTLKEQILNSIGKVIYEKIIFK